MENHNLVVFSNCVIRTVSGKSGYFGFINGQFMGFHTMRMVSTLLDSGFIHLTIPDEDINDFIDCLKKSFNLTQKIDLNNVSEIKIENAKKGE